MQNLLNEILPLLITAIVGILVAIFKAIGDVVINYIEVKKQEVIARIGVEKYNQEKALAMDIWYVVEEHYRLSEKVEVTMNAKIDMFDKLIKEKIPYITDEQIIILRQAIAGEINRGKEAIIK